MWRIISNPPLSVLRMERPQNEREVDFLPRRDASPWERSACSEIGSPSLHTRNRSGWDEHKRAAVTITAAFPRRNGYRLRFGDEAAHSVWNLIDGFTADMFECAYKSRAEYRYRQGFGLGVGLARGEQSRRAGPWADRARKARDPDGENDRIDAAGEMATTLRLRRAVVTLCR